MKKFRYIATIIMSMMLMSSCYKDLSKFDTNKIDEITIDASSTDATYRIGYLERLQISPKVSKGNDAAPGNFSYHWELLTLSSIKTVEARSSVSDEKDLDITVAMPISSNPYSILLTVTDDDTGLQKQYSWPLYVSSLFGEGIVVCDTRDGMTSDFSLIMDNAISADYNKGKYIKYNILEMTTGSPYPSLVKSINYSATALGAGNYVNIIMTVFEDKEIFFYNCEDYSVYKKTFDLMPAKPTDYNPQAFINTVQGWGFIENSKLYAIWSNQSSVAFLLPLNGQDGSDTKVNHIDNAITSLNRQCYYSDDIPHIIWYDNERGKIFRYYGFYGSPVIAPIEKEAEDGFDPSNLPDRRAVAGDISTNGNTHAMLLKNTQTSNYELYLLPYGYSVSGGGQIAAVPKSKLDLPAGLTTVLDRAVSVFFSFYEPIMYVATPTEIYAVTYGGGFVNYSVKYTAPVGESIVKAQLFVQGRYLMDGYSSTNANLTQVPWNYKAVVVATQKSTYEGNVYVVPQKNPGSGDLDATIALKYSGFGKILDITIQGK